MRIALSLLGAGLLASVAGCKSSPPQGTAGPSADELAREMQAAVAGERWTQTGAVQWEFAGRNRHLWDRRRGFSMVEWGDTRALIAVDRSCGLAFEKGKALSGDGARNKMDEAHAKWTNDAFWLNPVMKAFDPGTVREELPTDDNGRRGLLVRYETGGRTPGDAYLWLIGDDGRPVAWRMWTSNIPIGGAEASWERWKELSSGALVSTKHDTRFFTIELKDVAGATTLEDLVAGEDPFAALQGQISKKGCQAF